MTAATAEAGERPDGGPDYFSRTLQQAKQVRITLAGRVRLEALMVTLADRGVAKEDPRIPLWAAAAICRTAEERDAFLEALRAPEAAPDSEPEPEPAPAVPKPWAGAWLRRRWRALAGIAALGLGSAFALWYFSRKDVGCGTSCPDPPGPGPGEVLAPVRETVPITVAETVLTWGAVALVIPFLCLAAWHLWARRTRAGAVGRVKPAPRHASPALIRRMPDLFLQGRPGLRRLLRHETAPGRSVNTRQSIAATIRSGGFPIVRYGTRRRTPEYLLLSERESGSDHMALLARALFDRISREQVPVRHFEFFEQPTVVHRVDRGRTEAGEPLSTLLANYPDARILLVMEGYEAAPGEEQPSWLSALTENRAVIHLNPRHEMMWGATEGSLGRFGLASHYLGGTGLAKLGTEALARPRSRAADAVGQWDLAETYARHRSALLSDELSPALSPGDVVDDLRHWLGTSSIQWLATLALYPRIVPRLTVALGQHVHDDYGRPLFAEERLIDLARLPWLRTGYMPDWLRAPLARTLSRESLARATEVIQAMLLAERSGDADAGIDPEAGADPRARADLVEWLAASKESELHDRLLIDAMKEKRPSLLGRDWYWFLPRPLRWFLGNRTAHEGLAVVAITAATFFLLPPYRTEMIDTNRTTVIPRMKPVKAQTPAAPVPGKAGKTPDLPVTPSPGATSPTQPDPEEAEPSANAFEPPIPPPPVVTGIPPKGPRLWGPTEVLFDWQSTAVTPQGMAILDNVITEAIGQSGNITIAISCSTDDALPSPEALALTVRQCANLKGYLQNRQGSAMERASFYTVAMGTADPSDATRGVRDRARRMAVIQIFRTNAEESPGLIDLPGCCEQTSETFPSAQQTTKVPPQRPPLEQDTTVALSLDERSDALYDRGQYREAFALNTRSCNANSFRGCYWNGFLIERRLVAGTTGDAIGWYDRACSLKLQQGCQRRDELKAKAPPPR
jgi:cell division septation protein DedD